MSFLYETFTLNQNITCLYSYFTLSVPASSGGKPASGRGDPGGWGNADGTGLKQVSKAHCQSCTSPPHFFPLICDSLLRITLPHSLFLHVSLTGHRVMEIVPESSRWIDQSIAETFDVVFTTLDHTAADCNQGLLFLPWWLLRLLLAVTHKGMFLSSTLTVRGDHLQHLQQQQHLYASALPCKTAFVEDAKYLSLLLLCLISFFSFSSFAQ